MEMTLCICPHGSQTCSRTPPATVSSVEECCGLRRAELAVLRLEWIQQRGEVLDNADLVSKGDRVETVPIQS